MQYASKVYLGFDFGLRRLGVAVGQSITKKAMPLNTLLVNQGVPQWNHIQKLILEWHPQALIVGIPTKIDGSSQKITQSANLFIEELSSRFKLPVWGVDERFTTKAARSELFDAGGYRILAKAQIDSVAAAIILEQWLCTDGVNT